MANMAAGLNGELYTGASGAATGDINRTMTADTANQQAQQAKFSPTSRRREAESNCRGARNSGAECLHHADGSRRGANGAGAESINAQMQNFQQAWGIPLQQFGVLQSA
jgi:hypothetical protein